MTCIVGVEKDGVVWLGGDRAATEDGSLNRSIIRDPKVFRRGELGFGVCGLPKVIDAIAHAIDLPTQTKGSDRAFLVGELVPALRAGLTRLDCTSDEPPYGTCFVGSSLLAYRGCLYVLQSNFQLVSNARDYAAVGSGASFALGSFAETWRIDQPRKRVVAALRAAADGNAGVSGPFDVIVVDGRR